MKTTSRYFKLIGGMCCQFLVLLIILYVAWLAGAAVHYFNNIDYYLEEEKL